MKKMAVLEALQYLKENATDMNLAEAIAAAFDERLDELESIIPKDDTHADALEEEIDAVSELADLMIAVQEECKAYAKAVKHDANADDSDVQDVLAELEEYVEEYEESFGGTLNAEL